MTSPTESQQRKAFQRLLEQLTAMQERSQMLEQILWVMVAREEGSKVVLTEQANKIPPLYELVITPNPEGNVVVLQANIMPDPTKEQLDKLVAYLLKNSKAVLAKALKDVGLEGYPVFQISVMIQSRVCWTGEEWTDTDLFKALKRQMEN